MDYPKFIVSNQKDESNKYTKGGRGVHSLLQLSVRWPCHIWLVGRIKLASLKAIFGWGWGLLVYPILLFSLPLSGRCPDMTEILLTWTLSLNQSINAEYFYVLHFSPVFILLTCNSCKHVLSIREESSVDPDQMALLEPSDLDLQWFHKRMNPGSAG